MADTRYWLGAAIPVPEVKSYEFTGTWVEGETASITINGKTLTLTAGTTVTVEQMASDMVDMINGAGANQNEGRSALGSAIGEFAPLTASSDAGVVLITGAADGRPIGTVTVGDASTDGAFSASTPEVVTTGTGPNYADNIHNWSGDAVPIAGDTIVFDHHATAGPKFNMAMAIAPAAIHVTDGFRYSIGLPQVNRDTAAHPFDEHLPTYMTFTSCADVRINAVNAASIRLDFGAAASGITVEGTGRSSETGVPALLIKANHASNALNVVNGDVGVCVETGTVGALGTLSVGGQGAPSVKTGSGVALASVTVNSGSLIARSAITTLVVNGGSVEQIGAAIGTTTLTINGGSFFPRSSGTHANVNQSAGTIDCTRDCQTRTVTNYYMYGGALKDPNGTLTLTNGLRIYPKLSAVSLDLPPIRKYTLGAV
ncbi:MAG: hypothetical protein GXY58_08170 [Planctomycetaceae bacterium]|nr:hypothetical protein [Planctomycetaceae bacterium]